MGGRWKPLHYLYKRSLYADVMATCGGDGTCYLKNDRAAQPFSGTVTLEALSFADGTVSTVHTERASLPAGAGISHYFHAENLSAVPNTTHMLIATVRNESGDAVLSVNEIPLVPPMAMRQLPPAAVSAKLGSHPVTPNSDGTFDVTLSTNATALYVTLTTAAHGRFSDNFFAMPAGSSRVVKFVPFSTFDATTLAPSLRVEHLQMYL